MRSGLLTCLRFCNNFFRVKEPQPCLEPSISAVFLAIILCPHKIFDKGFLVSSGDKFQEVLSVCALLIRGLRDDASLVCC